MGSIRRVDGEVYRVQHVLFNFKTMLTFQVSS